MSPLRAVISFGLFAFLLSAGGRHEEAPLFFTALGVSIFGLTAWVDWHRANPPGESATTRRGIVKALLHALGALAVGLFFVYELHRAFPLFTERLDWVQQIVELMLPAGLATMAYQRRAGWERDDPESPVIEGAIAAVLAAVLFLVKGLL